MQPEIVKFKMTPAQVGRLVAGEAIRMGDGPIRIEIVMGSVANEPPKCPYEYGTWEYHMWWEAHHKITIQKMRMNREPPFGPIKPVTGHDIDKATRRCRGCGAYEINILGRPNLCQGRCMKHVPAGYEPCTRPHDHDGPCAQPLKMPDCNLCGKPLNPGERENHQECMARENQ